ncbi:phage tail protein [Aureimonas sp. Leaf454]|uniref:phage tail tape measure protein n=1 Tax=Aureimonas sp. Leaf454 TaxID=1736381 RepID=UPI0006F2FF78|nr:phage tail tape measure protein [Aureimonas sp. Leaf454]KQT54246.1 phage tail protein [Aureimonas sp. Leaf454]
MAADETFQVAVEADTTGFERSLDTLSAKASAFGAAFTGALTAAASGGRSLDGVMRQLGQRISSIALGAALKPLETAIGGMFGQVITGLGGIAGASPNAAGAVPRVTPFAKGGVVAAPTFFPNGRQIGLMGEAGAEAILPLKRAADGTLGVASGGGGARSQTIVFNVATPDAASFRRSEAQMQALLARAAGRGQRGL